jgi:hypothetical protein
LLLFVGIIASLFLSYLSDFSVVEQDEPSFYVCYLLLSELCCQSLVPCLYFPLLLLSIVNTVTLHSVSGSIQFGGSLALPVIVSCSFSWWLISFTVLETQSLAPALWTSSLGIYAK